MHKRSKECTVYTVQGDEYILSICEDGDKYNAVLRRVGMRAGVFRFWTHSGTFTENRSTLLVVPNVFSATKPTKGEVWTVEGRLNGVPYSHTTGIVECVYDAGVFPVY